MYKIELVKIDEYKSTRCEIRGKKISENIQPVTWYVNAKTEKYGWIDGFLYWYPTDNNFLGIQWLKVESYRFNDRTHYHFQGITKAEHDAFQYPKGCDYDENNKVMELYTIENFVFPSPYAKGEAFDMGVYIPFGPNGKLIINTDGTRAFPVCFDSKEDCVKWMNK